MATSDFSWDRIEHVRGDTFELSDIEYVDNDASPIDLTGSTITLTIRDACRDQVICSCVNDDGITITDAAGGVFDVLISAEKTQSAIIPIRDDRLVCSYDIQVAFSDGRIKTPARGEFIILRDATRIS